MLWLGACSAQASVLPDSAPPGLTTFAFPAERPLASDTTPLGPHHWMIRIGEKRVPVFDKDTPIEIVIMTLQQWGLEPEVGRISVIVREGPSRNNFSVGDPLAIVYGFNAGKLNVGPLTEHELIGVFVAWGLGRLDYELLQNLDDFEPLSAAGLNNMAWALATYHDETRHAPKVALELAIRANEASEWSNAYHLDTLAAAYAAVGRFDQAATHQQWAMLVDDEDMEAMADRLELYKGGQVYVEPEVSAELPDLQAMYEAALTGDPAAQWEFALLCLRERIGKFGDIEQPGRHFLSLAAHQGQPGAIDEIAYALLHGEYGLDADPIAARTWLERGAAAGSDLSAYNLASLYRGAGGNERDEEMATYWLQIAADRGLPEAAVEVAYRYLEGIGADVSPQLADELFAKAAAKDIGPLEALYGDRDYFFEEIYSEEALEALPRLNIPPREFPGFLMDIVNSMEQELERGQPYVSARLPDSFVGWESRDAPLVMFLLTRAAARFGMQLAQERVADMYEDGRGVAPSAEEASYWRRRAARNKSSL